MMSKVSENGPAFLLRMRLVSCTSFIDRVSKVDEFHSEHFFLVVRQGNMMEIEPVHRPPIDMGRIMQTGKRRNSTFPFRHRMVKEWLPAQQANCGGNLLRSCCGLKHQ